MTGGARINTVVGNEWPKTTQRKGHFKILFVTSYSLEIRAKIDNGQMKKVSIKLSLKISFVKKQ